MSKIRPISAWLHGNENKKVAISPDCSLGEFRAMVAGALSVLESRPERKVALAFDTPVLFHAGFLAVLLSGRTPVMFGVTRANAHRLGHAYDVVLSEKPLTFESRYLVWNGKQGNSEILAGKTIDNDVLIHFYTSGSTGRPKLVEKNVAIMEREVQLTGRLFGDRLKGCAVAASIDFGHLYGTTFFIWLPMSLGLPIYGKRFYFPDEINAIGTPLALITSPTFIRHIDRKSNAEVRFVLSAGGELKDIDNRKVLQAFGINADEIYGSTETGVIAHRTRTAEAEIAWKTLPGITLTEKDGSVYLISPLIGDERSSDDCFEWTDDGGFYLRGRKDRIVKIGEKRFSIDEIQTAAERVSGHSCRVVVLNTSTRVLLGAVVVGAEVPAKEEVEKWKREMRQSVEICAIPKYWRSTPVLPMNAQGKVEMSALQELFYE